MNFLKVLFVDKSDGELPVEPVEPVDDEEIELIWVWISDVNKFK